jgi:hypothetical protein
MKKYIFILIILFFYNSNAQSGFETILLADKNDTQKILKAYFTPKVNGYINNLHNGWYHTAKAHKPFGFDFSISLSNAMLPDNEKTFRISGLNSVNNSASVFSGSTASGSSNIAPVLVSRNINGQNVTANFNFPGGTNGTFIKKSTSIPIAQLSIGLPQKFGVMIRVVPEMKFNNKNESLSILGVGLKKEITDWFGKTEKLPLHISLLTAYNSMTVAYGIENQVFPEGNNSGLEISNAFSEFNLKTFTIQAIASIDWPRINIYGGLGFNTGSADYKMNGAFKGKFKGSITPEIKNLETPEFLNLKSQGIMATIGTRVNLRFLKLFGSYSLQENNTLNIGIAIDIK